MTKVLASTSNSSKRSAQGREPWSLGSATNIKLVAYDVDPRSSTASERTKDSQKSPRPSNLLTLECPPTEEGKQLRETWESQPVNSWSKPSLYSVQITYILLHTILVKASWRCFGLPVFPNSPKIDHSKMSWKPRLEDAEQKQRRKSEVSEGLIHGGCFCVFGGCYFLFLFACFDPCCLELVVFLLYPHCAYMFATTYHNYAI